MISWPSGPWLGDDPGLPSLCRAEQCLHARLPAKYTYRVYTGLSKAAERQGHGFSEALMARLSDALCSNSHVLDSGSPSITTPRCYFYGPDPHSHPTGHPHCQMLMSRLRHPPASCHQQCRGAAPAERSERDASFAPGVGNSTDGDGAEHSNAAVATPCWSSPGPPGSSESNPVGEILVLGSSNMLAGGTGCHVWPAGLWLAQWLLNHPHIVAGRRCLELGAGTGVVGVACAQLGASQVRGLTSPALIPPHQRACPCLQALL